VQVVHHRAPFLAFCGAKWCGPTGYMPVPVFHSSSVFCLLTSHHGSWIIEFTVINQSSVRAMWLSCMHV
jgi:hypothetical protein